MANFMGPMAPPQAAPPQPAQLDIRTNPGQRAQFKSFMQGMQTPPTTAPIAPMLPAPMPSPMDQVDIFAPAPMASGGVVGGLQDLGQMSGQMVDALNTVIYGGGQGMGGGIGSVMQTPPGSLPPALPNIESGVYKQPMNTPMEMPSGFPFANSMTMPQVGGNMAPENQMTNQLGGERMTGDMELYRLAQQDARRQREGGFMGRVVLPGEGSFEDFMNMQPQFNLQQQTQLYEDGGPVRMRNGGGARGPVTFESGRSYETGRGIGEQNREMDALERAAAMYEEDPGENAGIDMGSPVSVVSSDNQQDENQYDAVVSSINSILDKLNSGGDEDMVGSPGAFVPPAGDTGSTGAAFNPRDEVVDVFTDIAPLGDPLGGTPPPYGGPEIEAVAGRTMDQNKLQSDALAALLSDPMNEFGGTGRDIAGASTPEGRMAALAGGRINTGNENLDNRTRLRDLEIRSEGVDAPGFAGMLAKGLGGGLASSIASNVFDKGRTAVLNENNQIVGYIGDGLIPGTEAYTGRSGYNPFGSNAGVTFDSDTGAYRVIANAPGFDSPDPQYDSRAAQEAVTPPPADIIADPIVPPADPIVTPPLPPVVAPSPRDPVDITAPILTGGVPGIGPAGITAPILTGPNMGVDPLAPVGLPQSFLDLLASFNRPAPRAMQDGGAVLDKAADDFLGALKSVA